MEYKGIKPIHVACTLFFGKLLILGATYEDCMGILVLFVGLSAYRAFEYLYPKRVDVFESLDSLKNELSVAQARVDELEHDVTALKFGSVKR